MMITPEPVVITVGFIGYLAAGFKALVAALATFCLAIYLLFFLHLILKDHKK